MKIEDVDIKGISLKDADCLIVTVKTGGLDGNEINNLADDLPGGLPIIIIDESIDIDQATESEIWDLLEKIESRKKGESK